jgi:hypothetical protein
MRDVARREPVGFQSCFVLIPRTDAPADAVSHTSPVPMGADAVMLCVPFGRIRHKVRMRQPSAGSVWEGMV